MILQIGFYFSHKMKIVKENINFERGKEPKTSMKVGLSSKSPKDIVEEYMGEVYLEYSGIDNLHGFSRWLHEIIKENFKSPTYGDYPIENAQKDLDDFLETFNQQNWDLRE